MSAKSDAQKTHMPVNPDRVKAAVSELLEMGIRVTEISTMLDSPDRDLVVKIVRSVYEHPMELIEGTREIN